MKVICEERKMLCPGPLRIVQRRFALMFVGL
jgi:hypothetical protein